MTKSAMNAPTRPFLTIYAVWHPRFGAGAHIARALFQHYRRDLYQNVAGGSGLPVLYRSNPPNGASVPIEIDMDNSETCAIVLLIDSNWTNDVEWVAWAKVISEGAENAGLRALVLPVAIDGSSIEKNVVAEQAVRWDQWDADAQDAKLVRLFTTLSYQFCRMLRHYLEHMQRPGFSDGDLLRYLRRVDVFLSHSKHDRYGTEIALKFRRFMLDAGYDTFFDVFDIPVGLRSNNVILEKLPGSAVVAIHTDSYSTREWCRREMIVAKLNHVPLVVANCVDDTDERGFPYMANVPIVRMDPQKQDRIGAIVARLMDEILKDFLWRCRTALLAAAAGDRVCFLPRPPELIVLTVMKEKTWLHDTLVYPDPPIGAEEMKLFEAAAPKMKLLTITEWLSGG